MGKAVILLRRTLVVAAATVGLASAHHSFADFDMTREMSITGTVKTFEFNNPHCWLWVVVPGAAGSTDTYGFESAGPPVLRRLGVTANTFKRGDQVTIGFHPLKDGRKAGELASAVLPDGTKLNFALKLKEYLSGGAPAQ